MIVFLKEKFFRKILSNVFIILMLFTVCFIGFSEQVYQVFSANKLNAIYNGNTNNKNVSLMINVYWGTEFLEPMLEIFKKYNINTTFFVGGMWASEHEELLKKMVNEGHEIANHGYYHKDSVLLSKERNEEEIYITHQLIKSITNLDMNLFAPPSGSYNNQTIEIAERLGYKTIMWTKDTIDWRDKDDNLIYNRAIKNAQNGDLILMHPTQSTLNVLEKIINYYINKGFNIVTVSKNLE